MYEYIARFLGKFHSKKEKYTDDDWPWKDDKGRTLYGLRSRPINFIDRLLWAMKT